MLLKKLREKDNYSQKDFGKMFNFSQQAIQQYETGKRQIPIDLAIDISNYYDISLDKFFEREWKSKDI